MIIDTAISRNYASESIKVMHCFFRMFGGSYAMTADNVACSFVCQKPLRVNYALRLVKK